MRSVVCAHKVTGRRLRLGGGQKKQSLQCDIDTGTQKHTVSVGIVGIGAAWYSALDTLHPLRLAVRRK